MKGNKMKKFYSDNLKFAEQHEGEIEEGNWESFQRVCAMCPYHDQCELHELCYSCEIWEEYMGEDL